MNVENNDTDCLRWPPADENPQWPSKDPTEDGLNFTGVSVPTPLSQLNRVEHQNHLAINAYSRSMVDWSFTV